LGVVPQVDVKPMTRPELRVELEWFCGCGSPDDAAAMLLKLLRLHPLYENRPAFEELIPDDGLQYLVLYQLSDRDLTEHGGTCGGGWLTEKGEAVKGALEAEQEDGFDALFGDHCVHGFGDETLDHDCMAVCEQERTALDRLRESANSQWVSDAEFREQAINAFRVTPR
jgi:hypothetical protein